MKAVNVLKYLVPICLTLASVASSALESTVEGASTTTDDTISSTTPDTLVSAAVVLLPNPENLSANWQCAVTASAEALIPVYDGTFSSNRYIFGISMDTTTSTQAGSDRTISFPDFFPDHLVVGSTFFFTGLLPGSAHTFYWTARKEGSNADDMVVADSSMVVVCSAYRL